MEKGSLPLLSKDFALVLQYNTNVSQSEKTEGPEDSVEMMG